MDTKEEVLQACTVEGLVVKLPNAQLDRKLYQDAEILHVEGGTFKESGTNVGACIIIINKK